jgi:hypothetical protein
MMSERVTHDRFWSSTLLCNGVAATEHWHVAVVGIADENSLMVLFVASVEINPPTLSCLIVKGYILISSAS